MKHRLILFIWALALSLVTSLAQAVTCWANMPPASNPDSAYSDNGDGTVTHTPTGLIWKRCAEGQTWSGGTCTGSASSHTWAQALTLASISSFAGKSDWRLPSIKELRSLVEECRYSPAINDTIFPNTPSSPSSYFWSGSPNAFNSYGAWGVNFNYGYAYYGDFRSGYDAVRLVRGGQSFDNLGANPQPDLVVSSLTAPATGTAGGQITISATVTNQGTASAAATTLRFYFSTDASITTGDTSTGQICNIAELAAGASTSCSGPVPIPSTFASGNYYFGAISDANGVVSESDEGNNGKASPIVVSAAQTQVAAVKPIFPRSSSDVSEVMQGGQILRWYVLESMSGTALPNQTVRYQIAGEVEKTTTTDADGLFAITSDAQTILSSNKDEIQHKTVNFVGAGSQDFGFTVATRSLEQTWLMEASLKGELGTGPAAGIDVNVAGMGPKFAKGWSVGFGLGGTFGVSAVHKANMSDDGYLYATSAQIPSNHALSTSRALGLEASLNGKSEFGAEIKTIAPKTFVGGNLSVGGEIKGTAKWAATAQFPAYFDPVNPIGPCHLGWLTTSDLLHLSMGNFVPDGYTPVEFLCGAPLSSFLSESKQSTTFGGTIGGGGKVGLSGYTGVSDNYGYQLLGSMTIAGGLEGTFQISGESTQKYKAAKPADREEKIELLYGYKWSLDGGAYLKEVNTAVEKAFKGKLSLKYADGTERKLSRTVVYNSAGAWKGAKLGVTVSSTKALSSGALGGALIEDTNTTIETDNVQDFAAIPGMPSDWWIMFNPSNIDKALSEVLSPSALATISPLKLGVDTERFFPVIDVNIDLGVAFGLKLKAGAGVKLSPSEKYQTEVAKITNVNLGGKSKRVAFNVESYTDDQYLAEQRKSPIAISNQMGVAISNFASKILASAKAKAAQVGEFVVAKVNVASDKVSQLRVQAGETSEEWFLTAERWVDGIKLFSSPIYLARNFATTQTEAVIGPIHFVNAKTAAGVERDALPNVAILTIGQVSQYLSSANLAATLVSQVRVYRLDFDTATKTLVGGSYQADTDQLTVNITRTGAYIMVIDTKAPIINSGLVANLDSASGNLRVGALLDPDATGINSASITLRVNGVNVLTNAAVGSYFNLATNNFGYVVPKSYLVVGNNEIQFSVADGAGNQQTVSTQVVVEASVCALDANPSSITPGGSSTLTATCTPAATSYVWTGGTCAGTTAATCTVTPTATTTYTVAGVSAGWTGAAASATVTVTTANTGALQPNANGTVFDPKTGLTWMRCSMGQTWDGSTCAGTASTYTFDQANALTGTTTFASQSDWRMPNIRELQTIVDRSAFRPAIDSVAFPNTPSSLFWSGSPYANGSSSAWNVYFSYGFANGDGGRSGSFAVRLVRGGQSFDSLLGITRPTSDYVDNGNGTVTHTPTGLMWKRCTEGQSWSGSTCTGTASKITSDKLAALGTSYAGQTGWRLPTENELLSLVDYSKFEQAINATIFPATPSLIFWSSSPLVVMSNHPWGVRFSDGLVIPTGFDATSGQVLEVNEGYPVRLVRNVQSVDSLTLVVGKGGAGVGTVSSAPAGISCGSTCSAVFASGASVTLTATPATGSTFTGWSGACTGTGSCTVSMNAVKSVTATFALSITAPVCTLSANPVSISAGGSSTLTATCSPTATSYTWTGGTCAGTTGATCTVSPTATTTYTVKGFNAGGTSTAVSTTVTVASTAAPVCTLSANPASVTAGGSSTLTATCNPPATSYIWTGGTCAGTTGTTCTVKPTATTTYSVQGSNASGTNQAASATVTVAATNVPSYTVPGTLGGDVFVLTAGNNYYGGAGNDTYIISPSTLRGVVTAKIIDTEGDNLIQLVDGMTITSSNFYADAAQLTLSSGATVQILGASKFKFQVGANVLAGDTAAVLTYSQFVSSLGASLSGTLPASGTAGYVVPTVFTQASVPVPSVAGSSYTVPGTIGDDVLAPSGGNNYLGGGGGDTYIISPYTLSGAVTAKIIDTEGGNVIQLVGGLTIASSNFFSNAVQLMLSNGASVQILGASGFSYQLGANAPAGVTASSLTYAQFAAALGASVPTGSSAVSGSANFVVPSSGQ